ncbi:YrhB domain-containing protein [Micromonospora echinofusca]|uniref:YrhB domain-containing protein n=1 Tax=Micromonospora echinofusca TaxID=47858 RepID=UPI00340BED44
MESARQIAERFLDAEVRRGFDFPVVIVDDAVTVEEDSYVFPYDGKGYVEVDDWRQAMVGNLPVMVDRRTGRARFSS